MKILMLGLVFVSLAKAKEYEFIKTEPVDYKSSSIHFTGPFESYKMKIVLVSPCKEYFDKLTYNQGIDNQLKTYCDKKFQELHQELTACKGSLGRATRAASIAALAASVIILIVNTGVAGYTLYIVGNIEKNNAINEEMHQAQKNFTVKALEGFQQIRKTIIEIGGKEEALERKLEFVVNSMKEYPTILALNHEINEHLHELKEILVAVNVDLKNGKLSPEIKKLSDKKLWNDPAPKWAEVELCKSTKTETGIEIEINFQMPNPIEEIQVLEANAFRFWNSTLEDKQCWMKYAGPKYIIANTTNNCYKELPSERIEDKRVTSPKCDEQNGEIDVNEKVYHSVRCYKGLEIDEETVQVKYFITKNKIYCFGHNITIQNKNRLCPEFVFETSKGEAFKVEGYVYRPEIKHEVVTTLLDLEIYKNVRRQLKVEKLNMKVIDMKEINETESKLRTLSGKISTKLKFKKIDAPKFLNNIFDLYDEVVKVIWECIESSAYVAIIVLGLIIVTIIGPMIHIILGVVRLVSKLTRRLLRYTMTGVNNIKEEKRTFGTYVRYRD